MWKFAARPHHPDGFGCGRERRSRTPAEQGSSRQQRFYNWKREPFRAGEPELLWTSEERVSHHCGSRAAVVRYALLTRPKKLRLSCSKRFSFPVVESLLPA